MIQATVKILKKEFAKQQLKYFQSHYAAPHTAIKVTQKMFSVSLGCLSAPCGFCDTPAQCSLPSPLTLRLARC